VVSVSVSQPPPPVLGKKTKKAVLAPEVPNEPLLHVLLHDTVIFPEGGGQPTDTGNITTADGALWEVVQAKRHGGHAVHYVKIRDGVGVDAALLALQSGKQVAVSLGDKGYERRYDHVSGIDSRKRTRTYKSLPRCPCIPRSTCFPRYSKHD
jgi:misacylated tRNA(Ala) deacylase